MMFLVLGEAHRYELLGLVEASTLLVTFEEAATDLLVLDLIDRPDSTSSLLAND